MPIPNSAINLSSIFLGVCLPSIKQNASKFKVQFFYFDEFLKMYFRKSIVLLAYDPQKLCKSGDIALIKELQTKESRDINHKVLEIVYHCGDVTDPITGKKAVASKTREDIERRMALYGKGKNSFDYSKAPRRGWQEGKRDFSHRESYLKYQEFQKGDECENQPYSVPF